MDVDRELDPTKIDVPSWIDQDYSWTLSHLRDLSQHGCESGCYMPAVTYWQALATMSEAGTEVLEYTADMREDCGLQPPIDFDWSQIAVWYLSLAVEMWARNICDRMENDLEGDWFSD